MSKVRRTVESPMKRCSNVVPDKDGDDLRVYEPGGGSLLELELGRFEVRPSQVRWYRVGVAHVHGYWAFG